MPSPTPLTPSEIVLVHGNRFAETKRPVGLALGLLLGIIVLLYFVFSELAAVHHTWSSRHWPHTEGKIVVSQVSASPEHKPQIRFSYEVENRTYTSETVWFGVDHESFEEGPAAALVAQGIWAALLTLPRTVSADSAGAVHYGNVYTQLLEYLILSAPVGEIRKRNRHAAKSTVCLCQKDQSIRLREG